MKEDKDDFSSRYKIKDNTRKDEYPFFAHEVMWCPD